MLQKCPKANPLQRAAANKACTGQVGFVAIFKYFSGFEFFLLPNIVHAHLPVTQTVRQRNDDT